MFREPTSRNNNDYNSKETLQVFDNWKSTVARVFIELNRSCDSQHPAILTDVTASYQLRGGSQTITRYLQGLRIFQRGAKWVFKDDVLLKAHCAYLAFISR